MLACSIWPLTERRITSLLCPDPGARPAAPCVRTGSDRLAESACGVLLRRVLKLDFLGQKGRTLSSVTDVCHEFWIGDRMLNTYRPSLP